MDGHSLVIHGPRHPALADLDQGFLLTHIEGTRALAPDELLLLSERAAVRGQLLRFAPCAITPMSGFE
jgi:hypothetical protein